MGCGDSSGCCDAVVVVVLVVVFVALPVVVGVGEAAAGMAIFDEIGNDDNVVVDAVANTPVVVIATVSTRIATI